MILRKLNAAISEQNWFTALQEILIVVVGIFIGLQVDDWNESRKDHAREVEYLRRIDSELAQDIDEFKSGITLANRRTGDAQLILTALADPTLASRKPTEFVRALVRAGFTYSPVVSDHTFEEIKSAGELGIIADATLRISITEYYQQVRQEGQWEYLREMNQTEYLKRQAGILPPVLFQTFFTNRDGTDVMPDQAVAAYERLTNRPELIEWLPITIAFLQETKLGNQTAMERAENLREKIAASLGNRN